MGFFADSYTIASREVHTIQLIRTSQYLKPGIAPRLEFVSYFVVFRKRGQKYLSILTKRQRPVPPVWRRDHSQMVLPFFLRERSLIVAGFKALTVRQDPDLAKMNHLSIGGIEFAMPHSRAGGHVLKLTGP